MFFARHGRHLASMGMKFGAKFHTHRCNDKGIGPSKLKFLLRFDQNVECECPAGAHTLRDFHKFAEFLPRFRIRSLLKFRWICSRRYRVMGVLS